MLLGFRCKNYKTYLDETIFSMVPKISYRDMKDSILTIPTARKKEKALSTSVIYGPNASGKTNILGAMDFLRCVVLTGNVRNIQNFGSSNPAIAAPPLISNRNQQNSPVELGIEFVSNGMQFLYSIGIQLEDLIGSKIEDRKIVSETLEIDHQSVFEREGTQLHVETSPIRDALLEGFSEENVLLNIARRNMQPSDLFLTNGFKSLISLKISEIVQSWFRNHFQTFFASHQLHTFPTAIVSGAISMPDENTQKALEEFGIRQNRIGYISDDKLPTPIKVSILPPIPGNKNEKISIPIPADLIESLGTLRFIDIFPLLMEALIYGKTLVFDEFDASIHPTVLKNIIGIFHNDEINVNHAQLIFNTHNPIFLDSCIFRRDEIKFTDRNDETGNSELYQLSDFKTNGTNPVRKTNSYMKNYFVHRYGAIREMDFSPFFKNTVQNAQNDKNAEKENG